MVGKPQAVAEAKKRILQYFQTQVGELITAFKINRRIRNFVIGNVKYFPAFFLFQAVVTIKIPKEHHRYLLGKGGQKLRDLEKATGCKITVPIISDPSDAITITGPKEGIEKAAHEIQVTSDEQVSLSLLL